MCVCVCVHQSLTIILSFRPAKDIYCLETNLQATYYLLNISISRPGSKGTVPHLQEDQNITKIGKNLFLYLSAYTYFLHPTGFTRPLVKCFLISTFFKRRRHLPHFPNFKPIKHFLKLLFETVLF